MSPDGSRGVEFSTTLPVCLFACLKKTCSLDNELDIVMFHHESWKPIYFGVKRSQIKR